MKRTAVCLAGISSIILLSAVHLHAAEQKIIFNTESVEFRSGTGAKYCEDKCGRRSGRDVKEFIAEGWKIVSSTPKRVVAEGYWYTPCNTCEPHGCDCIGTEYVLRKDGPAAKVETSNTGIAVPDGNKKTEPIAPQTAVPSNEVVIPKKKVEAELPAKKVDSSDSELDLLKKENDLLKQEIENLKNQLKSKKN